VPGLQALASGGLNPGAAAPGTDLGSAAATYRHVYLGTGAAGVVGTAVLVAGTVTVATTQVTASSVILLSPKTLGGTPGTLSVGTITPGTSFVINSSSGADTSTISFLIIN
jgi:hypothetical protein